MNAAGSFCGRCHWWRGGSILPSAICLRGEEEHRSAALNNTPPQKKKPKKTKPNKHEWLHYFPLYSFILDITAEMSITCAVCCYCFWKCNWTLTSAAGRRPATESLPLRSLRRVPSGRRSQAEPLWVSGWPHAFTCTIRPQFCCRSFLRLILVSECVTFDSTGYDHTFTETCQVLLDCFVANIANLLPSKY